MSLYAMFTRKGANGFGYQSTAEDVTEGINLKGKTYLVTGANSGLGHETARVLALRGATVLMAARSLDKAQVACASVTGSTVPIACELSDPKSVREAVVAVNAHLAKQGTKLDGIIANAGIMALPKLNVAHGYELQFFTNHIGHFMLVTGLVDALAADGRVVMLSSAAHKAAPKGGIAFDNLDGQKGYSAWQAYGQSKIANLLFAKALSRRFAGSARTANAVHPGVIATNLSRNMGLAGAAFALMSPLFLKSIPQGAATQVFAATHPSMAKASGEYLSHCQIAKPRADANDTALADKLWQVSEDIAKKLA